MFVIKMKDIDLYYYSTAHDDHQFVEEIFHANMWDRECDAMFVLSVLDLWSSCEVIDVEEELIEVPSTIKSAEEFYEWIMKS